MKRFRQLFYIKILYKSTGDLKEKRGNIMVTNASLANIPYMNCLPMVTTNFGGNYQVTPYQNNNYNLGMALSNPYGCAAQPAANPYGSIMIVQSMLAKDFNELGTQEINAGLNSIASQKTKLASALQNNNLDNDTKENLQIQLRQINEYEAKLNALRSNQAGVDPQTAYLQANTIKFTVNQLIATTNKALAAQQAAEAQSAQDGSSASGADEASGNQGNDNEVDPENNPFINLDLPVRPGHRSMNQWLTDFHDATYRWGTDDEKFESCIEEMTKDDIIERMALWNAANPQESFMEVFMADAGSNQKLKYGRFIAERLQEKAAELGVDLANDPDMQAINKELGSWFYINNGVADNYNAVIKKLADKMGIDFSYAEYTMTSK